MKNTAGTESGITKSRMESDGKACGGSIRRLAPSLCWILVVAIAVAKARAFPSGGGQVPGPALFPTVLAGLLGLLALFQIAGTLRRPLVGEAGGSSVTVVWIRTGVLTAAMGAYALLLPWLGFISASALLIAVSLRVLGYPHGARAVAFGLLAGFVLQGFFAGLMSVPLPKGWLG